MTIRDNCNINCNINVCYSDGDSFDSSSENLCSVCLDPLDNLHGKLVNTQCNHLFHRSCITRCLQFNNKCPLCRAEIRRDQLYCSPHNTLDEPFNPYINCNYINNINNINNINRNYINNINRDINS